MSDKSKIEWRDAWEPKFGDTVFTFMPHMDFSVTYVREDIWCNCPPQQFAHRHGLVFPTRETAEQYARVTETRAALEALASASRVSDGEWYEVRYCLEDGEVRVIGFHPRHTILLISNAPRFGSRIAAKAAIDTIGADKILELLVWTRPQQLTERRA